MKKILIIAMLLAATAARAFDFRAQAPTGQWLYYTVIAGTTNVKVVNPDWDTKTPPTGSLQIPATATNADDGVTYTVTEIDSRAFYTCDALTAVEIPSSVTSIGQLAFAFCTSLADIELPSGLKQIGFQAFNSCAYINDLTNWGEDGTIYIGNYIIQAMSSATGVITVAEGTTGTANGAFYGCTHLERIVLPASITMIGAIAFQDCLAMDTLEILATNPPSLGHNAFLNNENFTVLVPCHSASTYSASSSWRGFAIEEHCGNDVSIEEVATSTVTIIPAIGGIEIYGAEGQRLTISDVMGRPVAESLGGYVPLPSHGVYIVATKGIQPLKIVY